ncbi:hypothetical protein [Methanobrevibacter sp.]|uniref:hypothetical protein n=1 Tax=Methanobrevibacter sp. TaxID=66852 RepID=UPI00388F2B06
MRFDNKICFLIFLLIVSCGISVASAHDAHIAGHGFDIPDSFSLNESYANASYLENGSGYSISIMVNDLLDSDAIKKNHEELGFKFIDELKFRDNESNVDIDQQNFVFENMSYEYYLFRLNNESYVISFSYPDGNEALDYEESPVKEIINSLE